MVKQTKKILQNIKKNISETQKKRIQQKEKVPRQKYRNNHRKQQKTTENNRKQQKIRKN